MHQSGFPDTSHILSPIGKGYQMLNRTIPRDLESPASAGGGKRCNSREVALIQGASGSARGAPLCNSVSLTDYGFGLLGHLSLVVVHIEYILRNSFTTGHGFQHFFLYSLSF